MKTKDFPFNLLGGNAFVIEQIGMEAADYFALWAFGKDHGDQDPLILMKRWNRKHKNKLLLKGSGDVKEDLLKMIEIWKKENP